MPLKFKLIFTKSKTIKWVLFLVVLTVSLRLPVLTIFRITWRTDRKTNISALYLASVNRARESMSRINDNLNRGFLIWFNYVTMITCVIVLSYKLYQSSKTRQSCAVKGLQPSHQTSNKAAHPKTCRWSNLWSWYALFSSCRSYRLCYYQQLVSSTQSLIGAGVW